MDCFRAPPLRGKERWSSSKRGDLDTVNSVVRASRALPPECRSPLNSPISDGLHRGSFMRRAPLAKIATVFILTSRPADLTYRMSSANRVCVLDASLFTYRQMYHSCLYRLCRQISHYCRYRCYSCKACACSPNAAAVLRDEIPESPLLHPVSIPHEALHV